MSHQITERDGLFTVRQAAWHGLGEVLTDYPTRAEAQRIAHPWEPTTEPVYRKVTHFGPDRVPGTPPWTYEEIEDQRLVVRSDTRSPLGVVSGTYTLASNGELYDIAEAIEGEDKGQVQYETGGSLKGGAKVWLLLRLRDPIVVGGDPNGAVIPYYALQNAHDGSGSFRGQATMTRIVCDNTSQVADMDSQARGTEFVFRHTASIGQRIEEAKSALAGWRIALATWQEQSDFLMTVRLTNEAVGVFVDRFIPMPPPHSITPRVEANVTKGRFALWDIINGPTCEGINRTAYGMTQAAVEYLNHSRRAFNAESRFRRAYLERDAIVTDARELALSIASV